jgi:hypothetical protein
MFLGGLWHGASWNFVIWGVLHGCYLAIHKIMLDRFPSLRNCSFFRTKIGKVVSIIITQFFVFLAWIPFRVGDPENMIYAMQKFVLIDFEFGESLGFLTSHKFPIFFLILFVILHLVSFKRSLVQIFSNLNLKIWTLLLLLISLAIVFFYNGNPEDFIYFKF